MATCWFCQTRDGDCMHFCMKRSKTLSRTRDGSGLRIIHKVLNQEETVEIPCCTECATFFCKQNLRRIVLSVPSILIVLPAFSCVLFGGFYIGLRQPDDLWAIIVTFIISAAIAPAVLVGLSLGLEHLGDREWLRRRARGIINEPADVPFAFPRVNELLEKGWEGVLLWGPNKLLELGLSHSHTTERQAWHKERSRRERKELQGMKLSVPELPAEEAETIDSEKTIGRMKEHACSIANAHSSKYVRPLSFISKREFEMGLLIALLRKTRGSPKPKTLVQILEKHYQLSKKESRRIVKLAKRTIRL